MNPTEKTVEDPERTGGRPPWSAPYLLCAYLVLLVVFSVWSIAAGRPVAFALGEFENAYLVWGAQLACLVLRDFAICFPLAFLIAASLRRFDSGLGGLGLLLAVSLGLAASLALSTALRTALAGPPIRRPPFQSLLFLTICCCWGFWAQAAWRNSHGLIGWAIRQSLFPIVSLAAIAGGLVCFGLESKPLEFNPEPVGTEDRRRLVRFLSDNDPRDVKPSSTARITLTERDINQLISCGLSLVDGRHKGEIRVKPDRVAAAFSLELPRIGSYQRYVNLRASGRIFAGRGVLGVHPDKLRIGRIAAPGWLLAVSGPSVIDRQWHNKHIRPFLSALKEIRLADGCVTVAYGRVDLPKAFTRDALIGLGGMADMTPATRVYVQQLIQSGQSDASGLTLGSCLQLAFAEAKVRSAGGDPVHENRAAILALGLLLGHRRIRSFIGPELPELPPEVELRFRNVALRGRRDWTRHFMLSAALEVLSNIAASNAAGLLKEELDADGGSGFSFADLAADRAGVAFAHGATISAESARATQRRLAAGFHVDDFFPPAADLPEGLDDAQLRRRFGGVGGDGYERLLNEIDRRISVCAAYATVD